MWYRRAVARRWTLSALGLGAALFSASLALAWTYPHEAVRIERRLSAGDAAERLSAARDLRKLSPTLARPVVERALADDDVEVRIIAARAAVSFGYEGLGDAVVGWLLERDARLRLAATEVLRLSPVAEGIEPLGRVLSDTDERVRLGAASALGEVAETASGGPAPRPPPGELRGRAATALLGHLDDPEPRVRVFVVDALAKLGDARAALPLVSKLQDGAPEVRVAVARALGVLADARATSALVVALSDRERAVVAEAARALGSIGDPGAAPSLSALLGGASSTEVRRAAVLALGKLGRESDLEKLLGLFTEPALGAAAESALSLSGVKAEGLLVRCLAAPSEQVSAGCARMLASSGSGRAAPAILEALRRGTLAPAAAIQGLATVKSPEALVIALEHLAHPDRAVRSTATETLIELLEGKPDPRAAGPILEALEAPGKGTEERTRLLVALGLTGAPEAEKPLADAASATVTSVRIAALEALGFAPGPEGERALLAALDDSSGEVRRAAALSLRRAGSARAIKELTSRFRNGAGQDRAALALALWGPLAKSRDEASAGEVAAFFDIADGAAQDSLLEALVAAGAGGAASRKLESVRKAGSSAQRMKLAQAAVFAPKEGALPLLRALAEDGDPAVRAEASWGLGQIGDFPQDAGLLVSSATAPHAAVRTNSLAALAVLLRRATPESAHPRSAELVQRVCAGLADPAASVRASAVVAAYWVKQGGALPACALGSMTRLLRRDPSEVVRARAAFAVAAPGDAESRFELRRCQAFEVSPVVADACSAALSGGLASSRALGSGGELARRAPASPPELVFVSPRPSEPPAPRRPFVALEQAVVRAGTTDRRGAFAVAEHEALELLELGLLESR